MSQSTDTTLASNLSGTSFRTEVNSIVDAIVTNHSGTSAPSYIQAGMIWLNTAATPWVLYMYDGTDSISLGTINASTNVFAPANSSLNDGSSAYAADAGANDTYAVTNTKIPTVTTGMALYIKCNTANTGACTLNVNAGGAVALKKYKDGALADLDDNDILASAIIHVVYNGTYWVVLSGLSDAAYVYNQSTVTAVSTDYILISDTSDSNKIKKALVSDITSSSVYTVTARSSNTILGASDIGALFVFTSTFTQTFTAAATLGSGWFVDIRNDGTGVITLDPNASETIDGSTTMLVYPGESFRIVCDGSNFKTIGRKKGLIFLQTQTASASASIDFTAFITSDFNEYEIHYHTVAPATNNVDLWVRVSEDAGSNWKSGVSDYAWGHLNVITTAGAAGDLADAQMQANRNTLSSTAGEILSGKTKFYAPSSTSVRKHFMFDAILDMDASSQKERSVGYGEYTSTNAINGVRYLMSSGNISTGTFTLYGVRI